MSATFNVAINVIDEKKKKKLKKELFSKRDECELLALSTMNAKRIAKIERSFAPAGTPLQTPGKKWATGFSQIC